MSATKGSDAYAEWVDQWVAEGFEPYIITFMFNQLHGSPTSILDQMRQLIELIYSIYLPRVVRKPHSLRARDGLPIWLVAPDLRVYKREKQTLQDVSINGGLHFSGFALEPLVRRKPQTILDHFAGQMPFYGQRCFGLDRVHLKPITHDTLLVSDYLFKTVQRGLVGEDEILILPKHRSEVRSAPPLRGSYSIFG